MDTFWHIVGYIAIGLVGIAAAGLLVLWWLAKMMDPRGGAR